ncbi:hypothetical protein CMV_010954 [Castanea mollissima]|uniref:Uncharacterized protein n=1 Tax=Castanea mollissima TaxID=60419 RepID=A0A8J4R324_9ROSI|nr:hypothetical protein CMV_010954 [Castanea mollissima]
MMATMVEMPGTVFHRRIREKYLPGGNSFFTSIVPSHAENSLLSHKTQNRSSSLFSDRLRRGGRRSYLRPRALSAAPLSNYRYEVLLL